MMALIPLLVAVPLAVAALLLASYRVIGQTLRQLVALSTAGCCCVASLTLALYCSLHGPLVYWFGGWAPRPGWVPGICFEVDSLTSLFVALGSFLTANALLFSWGYFEQVRAVFGSLLLIFMAAMNGFSMTGDLFNLFVFFELMAVCAFALTAYHVEEEAPLAGALNFALTNSAGAYVMLTGLGLVYARTGALNLAAIGDTLAQAGADPLVRMGLALLLFGLLTKAAVVPFHMWLADAHAVAPSPVSSLFSGSMVGLGLYGAVRIIDASFLGLSLGRLGPALVGLGVFTAIVAGCMALLQRNLKRLLAFSTISHMGIALMGLGTLSAAGEAGGLYYLLTHGLVKASLFLSAGALLDRLHGLDEHQLRGRGKPYRSLALLYGLAALALMGLPGFGLFRAKAMLEQAGPGWFPWVITVSSALTGGAITRAGLRIFFGWGARPDPSLEAPSGGEHKQETDAPPGPTPKSMLVAVALPLCACAALEALSAPSLWDRACTRFWTDRSVYAALVLHAVPPSLTFHSPRFSWPYAWVAVTLALAGMTAGLQLRGSAFPLGLTGGRLLRGTHTGRVGDYLVWMLAGLLFLLVAMATN